MAGRGTTTPVGKEDSGDARRGARASDDRDSHRLAHELEKRAAGVFAGRRNDAGPVPRESVAYLREIRRSAFTFGRSGEIRAEHCTLRARPRQGAGREEVGDNLRPPVGSRSCGCPGQRRPRCGHRDVRTASQVCEPAGLAPVPRDLPKADGLVDRQARSTALRSVRPHDCSGRAGWSREVVPHRRAESSGRPGVQRGRSSTLETRSAAPSRSVHREEADHHRERWAAAASAAWGAPTLASGGLLRRRRSTRDVAEGSRGCQPAEAGPL